jgi:Uma2 family endonuclease
MSAQRLATIDDLYHVPDHGKAELVGGRLVVMSPTGDAPSFASGEIFASLREHVRRTGVGRAVGDNAGFLVELPHRQSFSPDAAFHLGPSTGAKFFDRAPVFAVEVRSEDDYGPVAEAQLARKRADYFAAGTKVVWDVDVLRARVVRAYRATDPHAPVIFGRGEVADAEPAVAGWSMPVDDLFLFPS